eukprot:3678456-Amphidinium_carterae.2
MNVGDGPEVVSALLFPSKTAGGSHAIRQGQQAQKLQTLHQIMNPTWNNETQQPNDFVRQCNQWRDEIFNYDYIEKITRLKQKFSNSKRETAKESTT